MTHSYANVRTLKYSDAKYSNFVKQNRTKIKLEASTFKSSVVYLFYVTFPLEKHYKYKNIEHCFPWLNLYWVWGLTFSLQWSLRTWYTTFFRHFIEFWIIEIIILHLKRKVISFEMSAKIHFLKYIWYKETGDENIGIRVSRKKRLNFKKY